MKPRALAITVHRPGVEQIESAPWQRQSAPGQIENAPWQIDVATWQIDIATWQIDVATGQIGIATWQIDVATGQIDVATGQIGIATWQIDVATGQIDVATGQIDVATGQIERWPRQKGAEARKHEPFPSHVAPRKPAVAPFHTTSAARQTAQSLPGRPSTAGRGDFGDLAVGSTGSPVFRGVAFFIATSVRVSPRPDPSGSRARPQDDFGSPL